MSRRIRPGDVAWLTDADPACEAIWGLQPGALIYVTQDDDTHIPFCGYPLLSTARHSSLWFDVNDLELIETEAPREAASAPDNVPQPESELPHP